MTESFSPAERDALYRVMGTRRDIRSHFLPDPIPDSVLARILQAAHQAPSVGLMQPWDFVLIQDRNVRQSVQQHVATAKDEADLYLGEQQSLYRSLKVEGILEAPLNIAVTCDPARPQGSGLGRQSDSCTAAYSVVCAVQNLWLAARAEMLGVGWVSILQAEHIKQLLQIPSSIQLVAYLCIGYASTFDDSPELERKVWEKRAPLAQRLHFNGWNRRDEARATRLSPPC